MAYKNNNRPMIGYWMSERKKQKLNWVEFGKICRENGYDLVKIDLTRPLEEQGPFVVILHKLTEYITRNDKQAATLIQMIEKYVASHIEIVLIDPFESVRILMDRHRTYGITARSGLNDMNVFTPPFVELTSSNTEENICKLRSSGVSYPIVCKPFVSQGTEGHKMAVVFNEAGVKDCKVPCVAQTFLNHNAVLFKIYVVGDEYQVVERPSMKNFYPSNRSTIFFDSQLISKPDSNSQLNILDPDEERITPNLDLAKVGKIVKTIRNVFNMTLFGIDIVVENGTQRHAIIDINIYPGYEGYPNFFSSLMRCIKQKINERRRYLEQIVSENKKNLFLLNDTEIKTDQEDSGFDTCDSSDERKQQQQLGSITNSICSGKGSCTKKVPSTATTAASVIK